MYLPLFWHTVSDFLLLPLQSIFFIYIHISHTSLSTPFSGTLTYWDSFLHHLRVCFFLSVICVHIIVLVCWQTGAPWCVCFVVSVLRQQQDVCHFRVCQRSRETKSTDATRAHRNIRLFFSSKERESVEPGLDIGRCEREKDERDQMENKEIGSWKDESRRELSRIVPSWMTCWKIVSKLRTDTKLWWW